MKEKVRVILARYIILGFMLLYIFTLVGCSKSDNKTVDDTTIDRKEEAEEETETQEISKSQSPTEEIVDFSKQFGELNGCAVIYSPAENTYSYYNESICKEEVSPYSTFKIVSTLIGLNNGIIEDETSLMNYNGTKYPVSEWNSNLTLREAFQSSCVWYFRQVINSVGKETVKSELEALQYGNCDISEWEGSNKNPIEDLNGFWLDSSLKLSPLEQVQVLAKVFEGQSSYSDGDIKILKDIMQVDSNNSNRTIYGKTGSSLDGKGWFVGFTEANGQREYFAIYLDDATHMNEVSGSKAKGITINIL